MEDFCMLFALRRRDVLNVQDRLADALNEDLVKNADMFDISRVTFSANRHPNATMRALEKDLIAQDLPFLYLLLALCETGMELTQNLADIHSPDRFASAAASRYRELEMQAPSPASIAQQLTEIKAEHAKKRLDAAVAQMCQLT